MKQDFTTADLKEMLERALGASLKPLKRLSCVNSINFKAVRERDGFAFLVKCLPPHRLPDFIRLVRHAQETRGTRAVQRVFENVVPEDFGAVKVICFAWCDGCFRFPDTLSSDELQAFVSDYQEFSSALQRVTLVMPGYTPKDWRDGALAACGNGFWGRRLRRLLDETPEETCCCRPEKLRVIHGDLHPGNFAFRDGRVAAFFDIGDFTWGYPALDFVRYFGFAIEHLSPFRVFRRRRLYRRFAEVVVRLPYPEDEWMVAINETWMERIDKKLDGRPARAGAVLPLLLAVVPYRRLRKIVRRAKGGGHG